MFSGTSLQRPSKSAGSWPRPCRILALMVLLLSAEGFPQQTVPNRGNTRQPSNREQEIPGGSRPLAAIRQSEPRACCGLLQACHGGEKPPSDGRGTTGLKCISDSLEKCSCGPLSASASFRLRGQPLEPFQSGPHATRSDSADRRSANIRTSLRTSICSRKLT